MNDYFKNFTDIPFQVTIKEFTADTCPTEPTCVVMQFPSGNWFSGEYTPLHTLIKMEERDEDDEEERATAIAWLKKYRPYGEVFLDGREWKYAAKGLFMEIANF